jgi:hypothetical protein
MARVCERRFAALVLDPDLLWGGADGVLECLRESPERSIPTVVMIDHSIAGRAVLDAVNHVSGTESPAELVAS